MHGSDGVPPGGLPGGRGRAGQAVVLVNYGSSSLLRSNVAPLVLPDAHVVVVDNRSTAAERETVRALCREQGWSLVEMADNRGFGAGVNAGVRRALELGCETLLLLNPDAVVTAETATELHRACRADPMALVGPRIVDVARGTSSAGLVLDLVDGRTRGWRPTAALPDPRSRPVLWLTAACLALHRDLWERVGGFDEGFFMYWEDVDLTLRALERGGHVTLRDDLVAEHDQGGTQGPRRGRAKSALYYHYNARNRLLLGARHLDRAGLVGWVRRTPRVTWEILLRGGRRQLLLQPRLAWAAAGGGAAGLRIALRQLLGRGLR